MHKFILCFLFPALVLSIDVSEFYNFQPGTIWIYDFESTDSAYISTSPDTLAEGTYIKSTITCELDTVLKTDTSKTFFFSKKDSIYQRVTDIYGNGEVTDTTYIRIYSDTIAVAIKGGYSYCLYPIQSTPYYCPYLPLCTNILDTTSDTIGNFFTKNDTLFYSRTNDYAPEFYYTNYREWSVFTGLNYSYTRTWYTDNVITNWTKLISFKEPVSEIKNSNIEFSPKTPRMLKRYINTLSIPKISSGYFILYNGNVYSLKGRKINIKPTIYNKLIKH